MKIPKLKSIKPYTAKQLYSKGRMRLNNNSVLCSDFYAEYQTKANPRLPSGIKTEADYRMTQMLFPSLADLKMLFQPTWNLVYNNNASLLLEFKELETEDLYYFEVQALAYFAKKILN